MYMYVEHGIHVDSIQSVHSLVLPASHTVARFPLARILLAACLSYQMTPATRESTRVRGAPLNLAEEQASRALIAQELHDLRRATLQSIEPDIEDESVEEGEREDESEEEEEEKENSSVITWLKTPKEVKRPSLSIPSARQHPLHHAQLSWSSFNPCRDKRQWQRLRRIPQHTLIARETSGMDYKCSRNMVVHRSPHLHGYCEPYTVAQ